MGESVVLTASLLIILISASSFSLALAFAPIEPILSGSTPVECEDLDSDLQVLVENEIIRPVDAQDALLIFNCEL